MKNIKILAFKWQLNAQIHITNKQICTYKCLLFPIVKVNIKKKIKIKLLSI